MEAWEEELIEFSEKSIELVWEKYAPQKTELQNKWNKVQKKHPEKLEEFQAKAKGIMDEEKIEIKDMNNKIESLVVNHEPTKTEDWLDVYTENGYNSQGWGQMRYCLCSANERMEDFKYTYPNLEFKVEWRGRTESGNGQPYGATIYAKTNEAGKIIINRKKLKDREDSILDWAIRCWKSNCNPKVFSPFLPASLYDLSCDVAMGNKEKPSKEVLKTMKFY